MSKPNCCSVCYGSSPKNETRHGACPACHATIRRYGDTEEVREYARACAELKKMRAELKGGAA